MEITITVSGAASLGNSTVARLIRNALEAVGFKATLEGDVAELAPSRLITRTDALLDAGATLRIRTELPPTEGNA